MATHCSAWRLSASTKESRARRRNGGLPSVPGTIVPLFGIAYLIRAAFAQGDQRRQFIINALINFAIAAVIMLVFNRR